uniref:Putative salivary protein n=1 Tax=Ixodes scapularis TaxID=6945 RepID=Q4PMJ0_IXOSC|nr:putative salivary protein [Ixodes scapularis]
MMVANFYLLMICLQIASTLTSSGAGSQGINITGGINRLAPNCETTVKKLCDEKDKSKQGAITRIDVHLRECRLDCHSNGGTHISRMNLPNGMPCALGAACKDGTCFCEACDQITPRPPR